MSGPAHRPLHLKDSERRQCFAGAVLWLLTFQFFIAEQIARLAWKIPYSMYRDVISDLGALYCSYGPNSSQAVLPNVCSPLHGVMNASFMLQGCLILGGALLVRRMFPEGWLFTAALFLLAIGGVGVAFVGVAPEDTDFELHADSASAFFLGSNLGMILAGLGYRFAHRARQSILPLACGVLGLLASFLITHSSFLHLGAGLIERAASYPLPLWLSVSGVSFLRRLRRA